MPSDLHLQVDAQASAPFEGPEKLLEIWFAPSAAHVPHIGGPDGKVGLRAIPRQIWEDMLQIVKCKVLSVIEGTEIDAYLLRSFKPPKHLTLCSFHGFFNSESSLFVSPHRLILKTCGTTLNLLGLPRILEIAANEVHLHNVYRFFYSRKSFMFPERQCGPHKDWNHEVEYLDHFFKNGAAYTVGKVNGDHWLLYMASSENSIDDPTASPELQPVQDRDLDYTIEILMSDLSPRASDPFFCTETPGDGGPSAQGFHISKNLGIVDIFPPPLTNLDAYAFTPCGYSSNALIKWRVESLDYDSDASDHIHHGLINGHVNDHTDRDVSGHINSHTNTDANDRHTADHSSGCPNGHDGCESLIELAQSGEGYYTIHVTPEQGWSYASFECNIPLSTSSKRSTKSNIPDLKTLIKRVVNIFEPGRITLTLFISGEHNDGGEGESPIEAAQRAFKAALTTTENGLHKPYKRTDKINYEFGSYDLAFASFELN